MTELFERMFNMSISASWVVLAVLLLRILSKRAPRYISCIYWSLVGIRLAVPVSVKSILSIVPTTSAPAAVERASSAVEAVPAEIRQTVNPIIAPEVNIEVVPQSSITDKLMTAAAVIWIAGMAAMLIYFAVNYIKLKREIKVSTEYEKGVLLCDYVRTPFVIGIIRPKICLPYDMDMSESEYVIAHERAHIKRKDNIWKLAAYILLAVYWYNPLIWVSYKLFCRDIEYACDEKVIKTIGEDRKKEYSAALVNLSSCEERTAVTNLSLGEIRVKDRVMKILNYKKPPFWVAVTAITACIAVGVCLLTDPIIKAKKEPHKDMSSQEVTVKEDGASKDDIAVSKDTEKDNKVTTSNPIVSEEPVTSSKPVTSSEPEKADPGEELAAKRKELFDKLSPTQTVEVRNQVVDWLLSDSRESEKKLYTDEEIAKMRAECDSYEMKPDLIFVTLTEKASKELFFKEFTPADFPGIDCKTVVSSSNESDRITVLTGKSYFGDDYILSEFKMKNRSLKINVNEQTNKNIIENMIKLQKMDIVEYVSYNGIVKAD